MGLIKQLTPVCEITGGSNTAKTIQERLVSCSVVDASGSESDSIRIEIDAQGLMEWPGTGQVIGCRMGYLEDKSVTDLGQFKLTRISESLLPNKLTLTGTAAPFQAKDESEFKRRRSFSWEATTIGDIVKAIAARHGHSPRVAPDLAKVAIDHLDQNEETDIRFLHRLAKKHDAVCKPVGNLLIFCRRGQVKSLSGRQPTTVQIRYPAENKPGSPGFVTASVSSSDKQKFSGVTAEWYDAESAEEKRIDEGESPRKRLRETFESEQAAKDAIAAEMRKIARQGDTLQLDCPGNPQLAAEGPMELIGFPSGRMADTWSNDRVTHTYNSAGYRCSASATRPV